ncbi:MAG: hypothetical protein E7397_08630 [Ruminococcaceae bacterium]|nr:hypothetical protein [Oscillospiraceae bacterium]
MEILKKLPMPDGMTKAEIVDLLLHEEYGYLPEAPQSVVAEVVGEEKNFCAGKATLRHLKLHTKNSFGDFSFPVFYACPNEKNEPVPCFIHINFRNLVPDRYQPTEELIDAGFAVLTVFYKDISSDDGDFTNGLAGVVYPNGKRTDTQCGKIGLWAWAAMRVMDYAQTLPEIDGGKISVVGHSRLGKTALLTGMLDERFFCAISNDSGCSGAALSRENDGETIAKIYEVFPFWFCERYAKYANQEDGMPFDQHYLIAANYPHRVYVASAEGDAWACPKNEYLSCVAASSFYEKQGKPGFVHPPRIAEVGECFHEGWIAYHKRAGTHYLSRDDWKFYIDYLNQHL